MHVYFSGRKWLYSNVISASFLTHPSLSVLLSISESIQNCRSLPSEALGELGNDSFDSIKPRVISPIDQRLGRGGVTLISGSDDKWKLCLCSLLRDKLRLETGVEVLRGMKLCRLLVEAFNGELCFIVSSRTRSKLPVDRTVLRDGGVKVEDSDRRLLSLAEPVWKL